MNKEIFRTKNQFFRQINNQTNALIILTYPYKSIPAREAEIYEAIVPHSIALNPSLARSALRFGTSTPIPPSWIAIELKLANPQSAKLAMTIDFALSTPCCIMLAQDLANHYPRHLFMAPICKLAPARRHQ